MAITALCGIVGGNHTLRRSVCERRMQDATEHESQMLSSTRQPLLVYTTFHSLRTLCLPSGACQASMTCNSITTWHVRQKWSKVVTHRFGEITPHWSVCGVADVNAFCLSTYDDIKTLNSCQNDANANHIPMLASILQPSFPLQKKRKV